MTEQQQEQDLAKTANGQPQVQVPSRDATVRERPILFSGEMVRAILDGKKTQTRRVMKPQPLHNAVAGWVWDYPQDRGMTKPDDARLDPPYGFGQCVWKEMCPHGLPGDRLWVRETFRVYEGWQSVEFIGTEWDLLDGRLPKSRHGFNGPLSTEYRADSSASSEDDPWRPSIFMPRWASRLTLEITDVRVERLQDASDADLACEGIECFAGGHFDDADLTEHGQKCLHAGWRVLWDSINAKRGYGWDTNPWVWVLSFVPRNDASRAEPALAFESSRSSPTTETRPDTELSDATT